MIKEDDIEQDYPCPCYKKTCTDCPLGFEKVLDLKNAGLVIYRHSMTSEKLQENQNIEKGGSESENDENGFILHNTKDADIISKDFLPEMEKRAIKCARCRQIMEHAIKILQKVSAISKNVIIGICDHCKFNEHPCCECEGALKKFIESKQEEKNKQFLSKEEVKEWLSNVQSEFKGFFVDEKETGRERFKDYIEKYKGTDKKLLRARSEVRINQICRRWHDRYERELEIRELCRQSDELETRPSPIVTDQSKKQIMFNLDNQLEVVDSTLTISLERLTKSAASKSKEPSTWNEGQIYTSIISKKDTDSKKYDRFTEETYLTLLGTQERDYYGDDILPAHLPTQFAHDKEKPKSYEEELTDETPQTGFIFSFPFERKIEEKHKREKRSSELINDIHDRIRDKNEEIERKKEEINLKKKEEEARKQRFREEKIKIADEKKRLAEENKLMEKKERELENIGLFNKSKDTVSLRDKTIKTKQSKSEADQKAPHSKSKSQVPKSDLIESKMKVAEIKSDTKPKSKTDESPRRPKSDLASSKIEQKKNKGESEVKSKQETESKHPKAEPKADSKQPKSEPKTDLKQLKAEPKADAKRPKSESEPKTNSKQTKAEPKSDLKQLKPEPKTDLQQLKVEPKADTKPPKSEHEPKTDSKQTKAEPKADSKQPKPEPKTDLKQFKAKPGDSKQPISEPKADPKQYKPETKSESKEHTEQKAVQELPKSTPKDASESKKSPLTTPNSEPAKSTDQSKEPKAVPKGPTAEPKESKAESKESKVESKQPKAEPKNSKAESRAESKQPKGEPKEKPNKEKDKKEKHDFSKVEKDAEMAEKEKDLPKTQKNTISAIPPEKPKVKEDEFSMLLKQGKDKKLKSPDEPRVPRRQLEAQQQKAQEDEKNGKKQKKQTAQEDKNKKQKKLHSSSEELKVNQIRMLAPSQNLLVLDLVKVKGGKRTLSQIVTPSQMHIHETEHKVIKDKRCPICINSNLELEYESRKKRIIDQGEIIRGRKIHCVPASTEEKEDHGMKPILFQIKYDDKFHAEIIEPPKHIPVVREYPEERKLTKTLPEEESKGVIHYALSDRTFIEKGWTMLPTEKVVRKMNVYRMRPAHPEFDWFEHNKNKRLMLYDTGERLAEFDDDGRGRWYYKNQRLALQYYDAEEINAQQRFVIYSNGEPDERGRARPYTILATFDYLGNGIVFDHSGKIRMKYNQTEGVVLDRNIGPASHWKWHTLNDPPMLQQVMIDTHMSHKDPQILKMETPQDKQPRRDNEDMLTIEFDNFIKEKSKKLSQTFKPFQIKMKAMKINEHFSLKVLDQATVYLIYRDGTTNIKLNLGMLLDHKEIVDTDTAEVGEVANNMERLPARTDSLAAMQKSVAYAQHFERNRMERERTLRPPEPSVSADKLTAAISRPLKPPLRAAHSSTATPSSNPKSRKPSLYNIYYDNRLF